MVEMMVALGLLSVVLVIFFSLLVSIQNGLSTQASRSLSNDQGRLAVQELDREIRSGNVLYDPSSENDATHFIFPGMALRIYTQANAPTRETGGLPGERCVQWRIKYSTATRAYQLQRREWTTGATTSSQWLVVATSVMNRAVSPQKAAFSVDPSKRIVNIALLANNNAQHGNTVEIDTTVEGRNTVYGGGDPCSPIPTYPTPDPAES
jgi:hypothetical protein